MNAFLHVGLSHFLVLSAILFGLGLLTVATRRNAVAILMGVELILNGAALNFVAFAHYVEGGVGGACWSRCSSSYSRRPKRPSRSPSCFRFSGISTRSTPTTRRRWRE